MTNEIDFDAIRPVCGAFLTSVWVCAPPQSVVRVSSPCLWAIRAIFHAVWEVLLVCQAATKCWTSPDAPVEKPGFSCFKAPCSDHLCEFLRKQPHLVHLGTCLQDDFHEISPETLLRRLQGTLRADHE